MVILDMRYRRWLVRTARISAGVIHLGQRFNTPRGAWHGSVAPVEACEGRRHLLPVRAGMARKADERFTGPGVFSRFRLLAVFRSAAGAEASPRTRGKPMFRLSILQISIEREK